MLLLEAMQRSFADTLAHGPAHLDARLFAGQPDRVLLGLKAHANTISHARLVALEDSFPLTRDALGEDAFNTLSRAFLDVPGVCGEPLHRIGLGLPWFLAARDVPYALVDLARTEWAWLLAYHAAEAQPFDPGRLAGLAEDAVLGTPIRPHPAARILTLSEPAGEALLPFGAVAGAGILLVTRPQADVRVGAIGPDGRALLSLLKRVARAGPVAIGELFARRLEEASASDPAAAFLALAGAGALAEPEDIRP